MSYPSYYPSIPGNATAGPTYTYSFDPMHRPNLLTDQNNNTDVQRVQYNAASQLTQIQYFGLGGIETRSYNSLNQLTSIATSCCGNAPNVTYNYPASSNNGKISSQVYNGETITYQYDSLNRLTNAAGSGWAETYGYDSFGNLVSKSPNPALSIGVNPATNQIVGYSYDANGNQLWGSGGGLSSALTYDSENRLVYVCCTNGAVAYAYDSRNQRVWAGAYDNNGNLTTNTVYFYGIDGQLLAEYNIGFWANRPYNMVNDQYVYFGSRRVAMFDGNGNLTEPYLDRLGSMGGFYPWGEAKGGNNPADNWSFATYWRDSATGLDYAQQRYYSNIYGRFMSPDPYRSSTALRNPQSWNRYAYVENDPVNLVDPSGRSAEDPLGMDCLANAVFDASVSESDCAGDYSWLASPVASALAVASQRRSVLDSLTDAGWISGYSLPNGNLNAFDLSFQGSAAPVAIGVCLSDPACALVAGTVVLGGAVIYVAWPKLLNLVRAIQKQMTARDLAPVKYDPYDAGRDENGNCKPPDPKKFVK